MKTSRRIAGWSPEARKDERSENPQPAGLNHGATEEREAQQLQQAQEGELAELADSH